MPSEDEIRRGQQEHPISPVATELLANIPKIAFDPQTMRRKLAEEFRRRTEEEKP